MSKSSLFNKLQALQHSRVFLLLSTFALICLSLSKEPRPAIGWGIAWLVCYIFTLRNCKDADSFDTRYSAVRHYICAFFLLLLAFTFYHDFSSGKPAELLASFGIPIATVPAIILVLTLVGSMVAYPALHTYAAYMIDFFQPIACVIRKMYKQFFTLCAIYLLGLLAIIRANFYYVDDMGRALEGYNLTGSFSRHMASYFATLIHGNGWLTDISPLPQILAALIMALAAVITLYVISERTDFRPLDIVCMVPFGLFPYFLQCLSYKYDAPYMALSVVFAVIPLLMRTQSAFKYIVATAISTALVCTTYQVSASIYPLCVAFLCFVRWNKGEQFKDTFTFLYRSVIGYVCGLLFFRVILMQPLTGEGYVGTSISLQSFPANIYDYFCRILEDFNLVWLTLFFALFAGFLVTGVLITKRKKAPAFAMSVFALAVMFTLSYGLYSFFSEPLTSPRSMYGLGILLSLLSYYIVNSVKSFSLRIVVCLLAWLTFVFTFTYGNALSSQKEYADFRTDQLLTDLSHQELIQDPAPKLFSISGTIGFSAVVENMLPAYPVLYDLVPIPLTDSTSYWGAFSLASFYDLDHLTRDPNKDIPALEDMDLLTDSVYHTVYGNEEYIFIDLK